MTGRLAAIIGPGGRIIVGRDEQGRAIVANFPATLPVAVQDILRAQRPGRSRVAGEERLTFAELDHMSDRLARGLVARGIGKGDRIGIAMRNCPSWIVAYMASLKAGGIATLLNGWWQPRSWSMRCS